MSVQDVLKKVGQWSVKLKAGAPVGVVSSLEFFGHIAIIPGAINPVERGDECLALARYVGVLRDVDTQDQPTLSGVGLAAWLGDENGRGDVIEAPGVTVTGATFTQAVRALLPTGGAITEGTLYTGVPGTISNTWMYQTPRTAIDYVCGTMGGEWRVNNDGTLDAGPASSLYVTSPTCVIARRDVAGYDMSLKALAGSMQATRSVKDYTSRVVLVAQALAGGTADAGVIPYKDLHGNPVAITRVVDETSETTYANAAGRAQALLDQYSTVNTSVRLSVDEFDVAGDYTPGDIVWVWDPAGGLVDTSNEVPFRGRILNPLAVRVLSSTWPVARGYTVAYRSGDGVWTDLTPWVEWETGGGQVEVADLTATALTSSVGTSGTQVQGGGGGLGDTAVPDVPTFGAFSTSSYQPGDGLSRAAVKVTWTEPLNTDGSTIVDGDHYEVRYRPGGTTDWAVVYAPWDQTSVTVTDLAPATGYDWQIRAVDYATPTNYGAWSATTAYTSAEDTTAPGTPAPPTVAASLIAIQVMHTLGLASGGTYNLPPDMDHLEVHGSVAGSGYTPDGSTLLGKLPANGGMVTGGIPAVGTFAVDTIANAGQAVYVKVIAVDRTGNRSTASAAASSTATLIDSAHISDLTASKITAGTISAALILSGSIKTGTSGARVEQDANGIRLYDSGGTLTVNLDASAGAASFKGAITSGSTITGGIFQTAATGQRLVIDPSGFNTIYFYGSSGDAAFINAPTGAGLGMNSGTGGGAYRTRMFLNPGTVQLESINASTQAVVGGRVLLTQSLAEVSTTTGLASLKCGANSYVECTEGGIGIRSPGSVSITTSGLNVSNLVTTGNPANVYYDGGSLQRVVSLREAKAEIRYDVPELTWDNVAALAPVTFFDRRCWEASGGDETLLSRQLGLIAEDVCAVPGLGRLLGERQEDGTPGSVNYDRLAVAFLPLLLDLQKRLLAVEGKPGEQIRLMSLPDDDGSEGGHGG